MNVSSAVCERDPKVMLEFAKSSRIIEVLAEYDVENLLFAGVPRLAIT